MWTTSLTYYFGGFRLDQAVRGLYKGDIRVALRAKCFAALSLLVRNAGRSVAKGDFHSELWPGKFVLDGSLFQVIHQLRVALGDDGRSPRYVATVSGDGYQFVAHVSALPFRQSIHQNAGFDWERHRHYAKGQHLLGRLTVSSIHGAIQEFERSLDGDERFAAAYAGLAESFSLLAQYGAVPPDDAFQKARRHATRALELDPTNARSHAALADALVYSDRAYDEGERLFREGITRSPACTVLRGWYAWLLVLKRQFTQGLEQIEISLLIEPGSLPQNTQLGAYLYAIGEYEAAARQLRTVLEMDHAYPLARYYLGATLVQQGLYAEAIAELRAQAGGDCSRRPYGLLGNAYARSGDRSKALGVLAFLRNTDGASPAGAYDTAQILAGLAEDSAALDALEIALLRASPSLAFLNIDPCFERLRANCRFRQLAHRVGLEADR
jgi:DNA-binding winged helix-turn-helix (wHTH) protein/Flp pilus assembly protein TadD